MCAFPHNNNNKKETHTLYNNNVCGEDCRTEQKTKCGGKAGICWAKVGYSSSAARPPMSMLRSTPVYAPVVVVVVVVVIVIVIDTVRANSLHGLDTARAGVLRVVTLWEHVPYCRVGV